MGGTIEQIPGVTNIDDMWRITDTYEATQIMEYRYPHHGMRLASYQSQYRLTDRRLHTILPSLHDVGNDGCKVAYTKRQNRGLS